MFTFNKYTRAISFAALGLIFILTMLVDSFSTEMSLQVMKISISVGYVALGIIVLFGALALFNIGVYGVSRFHVRNCIRR